MKKADTPSGECLGAICAMAMVFGAAVGFSVGRNYPKAGPPEVKITKDGPPAQGTVKHDGETYMGPASGSWWRVGKDGLEPVEWKDQRPIRLAWERAMAERSLGVK